MDREFRMRMVRWAIGLALVGGFFWFSAAMMDGSCESARMKSNHEKITVGTPADEVRDVLGEPDIVFEDLRGNLSPLGESPMDESGMNESWEYQRHNKPPIVYVFRDGEVVEIIDHAR